MSSQPSVETLAIVARIAEALELFTWYHEMAAEAVADALGLPAILSIVEEARQDAAAIVAMHPKLIGLEARVTRKRAEAVVNALDAIHNHLTGSGEES